MRGLMNPDLHDDGHEHTHDPPTTRRMPCPQDRTSAVRRRTARCLPRAPDHPRRWGRTGGPFPTSLDAPVRVHLCRRARFGSELAFCWVLPDPGLVTALQVPIVTASLLVRAIGGIELPLVCSPSQVAPMLGRSDHSIRDDCVAGLIPTLPRAGGSGAHHRIATARLLDQIGIPYEIVSSE